VDSDNLAAGAEQGDGSGDAVLLGDSSSAVWSRVSGRTAPESMPAPMSAATRAVNVVCPETPSGFPLPIGV
jgi:hypothetical protein